MKIFEKANTSNDWKCPICHTNKEDKVILIPILGTEKDHNVEAEQIHLACIKLTYDRGINVLYHTIVDAPIDESLRAQLERGAALLPSLLEIRPELKERLEKIE